MIRKTNTNDIIDWNDKRIIYSCGLGVYVLMSGHHDEVNFKGTVISKVKESGVHDVGDVCAFKKSDFDWINKYLTLKFTI